ncbi:hypothetical protein BpHYR1_005153 [Brachionus plicatilis]|uniref:Uncharacterized protein n=1 Tax=Brachionus plicatilis TaxID=10195 RepID=A0A3M7SP84_BRAPC|nr:hypothetical protein BpHYR1_005153 [Brachionus plicatilis]
MLLELELRLIKNFVLIVKIENRKIIDLSTMASNVCCEFSMIPKKWHCEFWYKNRKLNIKSTKA